MPRISKGTSSFGRHMGKTVHIKCRRCGRRSYHVTKKRCAACGYGETTHIRRFSWQNKKLTGLRLR
ncbi:MAG TPA: 50S ribosomal protein L37e [Candidatus Bathyarchaeia archaeon]|nr:50S ribosomal protein L37e [Candidatus Bathyarchaeia archaeon]